MLGVNTKRVMGTMGTQLNVESEDAVTLASELAELTGESLAAAVTTALRERLDRERRERDVAARVARVLVLGAEIRAHVQPLLSSESHNSLYGDDGLPT
jgi:antitoxin VapB